MKHRFRPLFALLLATSSTWVLADGPASAPAQPPIDCAQKYKEVADAAAKLPFHEFDQTEAGWRQLGPCPAEQASLLRRYLIKHDSENRLLHWHLAQTLAMAGDNTAAAEQALLSVNPDEATQHPSFAWNAYALATVAFLRNDRAAFDEQYEIHRRAANGFKANEVNFKVLTGLAKCFGKSYAEAYGACRP